MLFELRQNRRFFLSAIYPHGSASDPAQRQLAAIIGKEYFSHFVAAIVPAFKNGQLLAETLGRRVAIGYQRFQRSTNAAIEYLGGQRLWLRGLLCLVGTLDRCRLLF